MTDEEFKILIERLMHIGYHEQSDIGRIYWSNAIDQIKDMHKFCLANNMPVFRNGILQ